MHEKAFFFANSGGRYVPSVSRSLAICSFQKPFPQNSLVDKPILAIAISDSCDKKLQHFACFNIGSETRTPRISYFRRCEITVVEERHGRLAKRPGMEVCVCAYVPKYPFVDGHYVRLQQSCALISSCVLRLERGKHTRLNKIGKHEWECGCSNICVRLT